MSLAELLNLEQERHVMVLLADHALDRAVLRRTQHEVESLPTRLVVLEEWEPHIPLADELRRNGVNPERDYVSLLLLLNAHESFEAARSFFDTLPQADLARLELPTIDLGFTTERERWLFDLALNGRFDHQDLVAERFYQLLGTDFPYEVEIRTGGGLLVIRDERPWFQLGGRLSKGEIRILPGGEVAYTGTSIAGVFRADGAILATPQIPEGTQLASALGAHSAVLASQPVDLEIINGEVRGVRGSGAAAAIFEQLFDNPCYRRVTEVGLSFNEACMELVHDWPAASNEGYPGAHIALGGDPDTTDRRVNAPIVHMDMITRATTIHVNRKLFMDIHP